MRAVATDMGQAQAFGIDDRLGIREHALQQGSQPLTDRCHQRLAHRLISSRELLDEQSPRLALKLKTLVGYARSLERDENLGQAFDPAVRARLAQRDFQIADISIEPTSLAFQGTQLALGRGKTVAQPFGI